ncbi:hypothetical protein GE061_010519 [Apolygus lucorum]|uniref:Nucleoporin NUP35 n=1 Tax=Apolygus lucorum TaxID=248454 RepID=A0A8S9XUV4_APOLU|nr:hypothetical protein GE061_010519 [Apolygus lucorum]
MSAVKCPTTFSGSWKVGKCRCAEDRVKFRSRIDELTWDFARLSSLTGVDDIFCRANPVLYRTSFTKEKATRILEENIRLESLLEVFESCKNVFRTEKNATPGETVPCQSYHVKTTCRNDTAKQENDSGRYVPEYLLGPMRKVAEDAYPLRRQVTPSWSTMEAYYDDTTRKVTTDDECQPLRRPKRQNPCDRNEDDCVLVYGFRPEAIDRFVLMFSLLGEVREKRTSHDKNWVLFRYRHSYDASQACQYDLCMIEGCVIGVTRCGAGNKDAVTWATGAASFTDNPAGVIRVAKNLRIRDGKVEEFTPLERRLCKFMTNRFIRWMLLFFAVCYAVHCISELMRNEEE